jgi:hypothetical protein
VGRALQPTLVTSKKRKEKKKKKERESREKQGENVAANEQGLSS